jgi:hypothetical protein
MVGELKAIGKSWWCHGGGAAMLLLLATVLWFRQPRDLIFWAAIVFFVAHTAQALWRYWRARQAQTTATVVHHHHTQRAAPASLIFLPLPINSMIGLDSVPTIKPK